MTKKALTNAERLDRIEKHLDRLQQIIEILDSLILRIRQDRSEPGLDK